MSSDNTFVVKFAASIIAVLGCFDRVLFKGYLPFGDNVHLHGVWFPRAAKDVGERRRRTTQVPRAHRYRVTAKGETLLGAGIEARHKVFPQELEELT